MLQILFPWQLGAILMIIVLSACQSSAPLAVSTIEGPRAKLRVVSYPGDNTFLKDWTEESWGVRPGRKIGILGPAANALFDRGTSQRVGIPLLEGLPPQQTTELEIPAGRKYILQMRSPSIGGVFGGAVIYDWCARSVAFVPEPDEMYEVTFYTGADPRAGGSCKAVVAKILPMPSGGYERRPADNVEEPK